jgi:hypothetical protein
MGQLVQAFARAFYHARRNRPWTAPVSVRFWPETRARREASRDSAILPRLDILELIDRLDDMVHNAKPVPLTDQVRVKREEIYDLLDQMRATLPEEIVQARRVIEQGRVDGAKPGVERAVLDALTEASPLTLDLPELGARLGDPAALEETVSSLVHDGLVDRIGDRLRASSAAVRFADLSR